MVLVGNRELMVSKNKQYGSSWSVQRSSDMTGTMHAKVHRITQLDSGEENTFESVEDSYRDIINYALFCLIRLSMEVTPGQAPSFAHTYNIPVPQATEDHILDPEQFADMWTKTLLEGSNAALEGAQVALDGAKAALDGARDFFAEWVTWGEDGKPVEGPPADPPKE
jgi:hypothetical protein